MKLETKKLLERMENVSKLPYRYNKEKILEHVRNIHELTETKLPDEIVFCEDIFDSRFQEMATARATAMERATAMARAMATDYDFDYFCGAVEEGLAEDKKFIEIMEQSLLAKEAGLGYMCDTTDAKILYLAPNPVLRFNGENYHSDSFPAIEWATVKEYYLNGVYFPEDLWKKVVSGSIPFADILKIEDIDQRTQAMRYGKVDEFIKHSKGELLDSYVKIAANGKEVSYKLYKIPAGDIFLKDAYYAVYQCPSTDRVYMSGVKPCKTVAEAMSWKHWMKPSEWKSLIPLRTES